MELSDEKLAQCRIIGITGRLDTTTYGQLEQLLAACFDSGDHRLLADCTRMDYISSSGLRVLLVGLKKAHAQNGRFVLCGLRPNIREVFEISGFTGIFEIFGSKEEAIKTF